MQVRIAAKQIEKTIIRNAMLLSKHLHKVLPECRNGCQSCYFAKIRKEIEKLKDKEYVKKMANKKGFVGALASTLLLAEQKIPYVAHMKIGGENVFYAKRGKAKEEMLIGFQNWDKPHLRLLAYLDIAKKKKLNLFSLPDKIICSSRMPDEFFSFLARKFSCKDGEYIAIKWNGKEMRVCSDKNSFVEMKKYFYYPDFEKEVEFEIFAEVIECKNKCNKCVIEDELQIKPDDSFYRLGKISDKGFIENYKKKVMWNIERKKVFIVSNECYGNDIDFFIKKLMPKEWEKEKVYEILKKEEKAIVLQSFSPAKLLEKYGINAQKLKEEHERKEKQKILSRLPEIDGNKLIKFIDEAARICKTEGKEGLLKFIKNRDMDVKEKAISYAFLKAFGIKGEEWKYGKMEMEFGEYLTKYVKKLIDAEGEEYKDILKKLVMEAGG